MPRIASRAAGLMSAVLAFATAVGVYGFGLSELRWQNRPLLVFAASADDAKLLELRAELARAAPELRDRDMVVIEVIGAAQARLDGTALPEGAAADLRRRFEVPSEAMTLILVGKDGSEKLRASDRWDLAEVFALVDGMPMRRRELSERGSTGDEPSADRN
jgi:hypothetical protein